MLWLVQIRSTSLLTFTSAKKKYLDTPTQVNAFINFSSVLQCFKMACFTLLNLTNVLIKITTQNVSWYILLKISILFNHKSHHYRVHWKAWLNKALNRTNLPTSDSGYYMKVMLMTSKHFISIQRRNSFIRSKAELIIIISPETMDFPLSLDIPTM